LRFEGKTITAKGMRLIGHLDNESGARTFSDYLYAEGIANQVEPERDGTWALWIQDEDQISEAKEKLERFRLEPGDSKYTQARRLAREKQEREEEANEAARKRFYDGRRLFPGGFFGVGRLTAAMVAICVAVGVYSKLGTDTNFLQPLFITRFDLSGGFIQWDGGLPEVRHGQVWRLVTPIFIHFGVLHLFFNLLWLLDLGTMIERHQGWRRLAGLVLVIAIPSNLAQYYLHAPNFGGMSGVVYGLIGYIWLRGKFDPFSGLFLHRTTVTMAVIWYFLCLARVIPNVANTVHTVGFAVGLALGYFSAVIATSRR
jgi:GlpG protein